MIRGPRPDGRGYNISPYRAKRTHCQFSIVSHPKTKSIISLTRLYRRALPATPVDFHGTPGGPRWMAPEPGQHTDEVLKGLGRSADEIAALRAAGALG